MAIDALGVVARRQFGAIAARASDRSCRRRRPRDLFLQVSVALQQGETKCPLGGSDLLRFRASVGGSRPLGGSTISDVRAPVRFERDEQRVVGAGDIALGPALRPFVALPSTSDRWPRSSSARCAVGEKLLVCVSAGRCNGVSVSSVQMPCRSGSPQGVFSDAAGAVPEAVWLAAIVGTKASAGMIASEIPMDVRRRVRMSCLPLPSARRGDPVPHMSRGAKLIFVYHKSGCSPECLDFDLTGRFASCHNVAAGAAHAALFKDVFRYDNRRRANAS